MSSQKPNKSRKKDLQGVFDFIVEAGMMMRVPRSHSYHLGNTFDTLASHSHHTAIIAYCLARLEGLSSEAGLRSLAMGVLHDTPETRTGDLNFVEKHYAQVDEQKAIVDQLKNLPFAQELKALYNEYEERETLVSKCAKDADALEQMYQQWFLAFMGNKMAEKWLQENYRDRVPHLRTKSAKLIAEVMKKRHPHKWFYKDLVDNGINLDFLNGKK